MNLKKMSSRLRKYCFIRLSCQRKLASRFLNPYQAWMPAFAGMTKATVKNILLLVTLVLPGFNYAETSPQSFSSDPHIQIVNYDANQVYRIISASGYTTAIQFSDDEKILAVNIGDSSGWLVNVQGNTINLKPVADNPDTNMNVVTTRGNYQFFLTAPPQKRDKDGQVSRLPSARAVFLLRFRYPEAQPILPANNNYSGTWHSNNNYSARGTAAIAPVNVYDDGHFTYFNFGGRKDIPAIFSVDAKGNESLVNYHLQGNYVVVETLARQFTLRNGNQVASIFNEASP